ncbi:Aste57867_11345 [Aphanomyces stellatus]|uniref:Tripeptidyl-peptidase 2 n=1 Tax=Aphanomyces stellatus TaxID=120398 RepID=A0A485KUK4_9STRA|nr:hypothetical protein As57867_011303 [Aphanomyces stellatus]VFT88207.1 Aste57867_11345 [Aphanomyces stellatus]
MDKTLVPKEETLASTFLQTYPQYDGTNVIVAIFDTGVDPGAPGLQWTPDGRRKIIDVVDATGSSDVDMSMVLKAKDGKLKLGPKKVWTLNPAWTAVDNTYRVGFKRGYEFYPAPLVARLKDERKTEWLKTQRPLIHALQQQLAAWTAAATTTTLADLDARKEIQARLSFLEESAATFDDPGPHYDCVAFFDGTHWRAAVDASETGDFSAATAMANFRVAQEYAKFSDASQLNYALNVYDDGAVLSIVCDAGSHGTHVAGIVAAYHKDDPINNGVAPGAQIVSVKIGDSRLGATETGVGICRGILAVLANKCDIVNMSFGEHAARPNYGRPVEMIQELVEKHGVLFVASVGNDGPALGTIKSPGGLSSCILGVGAYVSPAMMAAEYSMRERHDGGAYTWSSRGPAMDGDLGVNVFAPGGAITSVPQWTLMKKQLKNGTSMASPNCAGCVALLLSGLKDRHLPYHPYLVRRAFENTAVKVPLVESFAQGRGLIQVVPAFDYLVQHSVDAVHRPLYYDVRVSKPGALTNYTRGICIREAPETNASNMEFQIKVTPVFHVDAPNDDRLALDVSLSLVASHGWLSVPSSVAMFHEGRAFFVHVQVDHLPPGDHYGEIVGYDSHDRSHGPYFRVPVTVVKPMATSTELSLHKTVAAGAIFRSFVTVPAGATWMDVHVTSSGPLDVVRHRIVVLHLMQYETYTRPSLTSLHKRVALDVADTSYSMAVRALSTVEVCVAPMWNMGGGPVPLQVDVVFRGIEPDQQAVVVQGGQGSARVNVKALLRQESILPQAKLTTWTQRFRPTDAIVEPCSARNTWPEARVIYQLVLTFKFTKPDDGKVVLRLPILNGRLYDAPFESQLLLAFDTNKKLMGASDAVPKDMTLPKGAYVVRAQVRHEDYSLLEKLVDTVLFADYAIKDVVVPVYDTSDGPSLKAKPMGATLLQQGMSVPMFVGEPDKLPKGVSSGDTLSGTITYGKKNANQWQGVSCKPDGFSLTYVVPPAETKRKEPEVQEPKVDDNEEDVLREFIVTRVNKAIGKDHFTTLWTQAIASYPAYLPLLRAKLGHVDHEKKRLEHLQEIVDAAVAIETCMAPLLPDLAMFYGLKQLPGTPASEKAKKDKDKALYVDALSRKARALGDLNNVVEFDKTFATLHQWTNVADGKYLLVGLMSHLQKKQYGLALQRFQKWAELDGAERDKILSMKKASEKKQEIFAALGWSHLVQHERRWLAINAPAECWDLSALWESKLSPMNPRDSVGTYLSSLRSDRKCAEKIDEGVPFFVPQLSKVKTSAMCTKTQTHLLFGYERLNVGESYRKQGDKSLYTDEKLLARHNLQHDRQVQAALGRFWDTFGSIRGGKSSIDELEYCDVFVKLFKALVPPQEFSVPEARIIVEKDWARDVGADCNAMGKAMFYKALFEVADLWTVGIGVDEYTKFLSKLFDRVTMTVYDQEKALWLTKFAELDMIKSSWNDENQSSSSSSDNKSPSPKRIAAANAIAKLKKKAHTIAVIKTLTEQPSTEAKAGDVANLPGLISPDRPPRRSVRARATTERRWSTTEANEKANDVAAGVDELQLATDGSGPSPVASPVKSSTSPKKQKDQSNQDRVAMPSIYLSPDLDVQKEDDVAVKRRLRENTKLVQRLRRTTY